MKQKKNICSSSCFYSATLSSDIYIEFTLELGIAMRRYPNGSYQGRLNPTGLVNLFHLVILSFVTK